MRVWITGATGFVGSRLTERLLSRGDELIALVRPRSIARAARGVHVVEATLPDVGALTRVSRPDVVFHCAAALEGTEAESHAVNVEATLRLAEIAGEARFVHVSTTHMLPLSSPVPLNEAAACVPRDVYGRTKLEGERRLLERRPDAVVLRPPGIYGPGSPRDAVLYIALSILHRRFFHVGDGNAVRSWIFVENFVDAMLSAAARPELSGIFLVDDGRAVSRREFAAEVARALGRSARFPRLPLWTARAAAWGLERVLPRLGLRSPLTSEGLRYASEDLRLDTTRWKNTGFVPRFSVREAIASTVGWWRANGRLPS